MWTTVHDDCILREFHADNRKCPFVHVHVWWVYVVSEGGSGCFDRFDFNCWESFKQARSYERKVHSDNGVSYYL